MYGREKKIKILLVEDNPSDVVILAENLERDQLSAFDLTNAELLSAALDLLRQEKFDIILLDLGLPDSFGLDTFARVHQAIPNIPIIVLSGRSDEDLALEAVQAGAQDYLVKGPAGWSVAARSIRYAIERWKSEQRFYTVFYSSPTPQNITNVETGQIVEVNAAYCQLLGYAPEELLGHTSTELGLWVDPDVRQKIAENMRANGSMRDYEIEIFTRSKGVRILLAGAEPIELRGEKCILSSAVDITERKRAESELRESEERFSTAFFTNPISQSIHSLTTGLVVEVNDACCALYGFSREELIGTDPGGLNLWANPADQLTVLNELQKSGRLLATEIVIRRKSGELHTILFAVEPITWKGMPCLIESSVDITERKLAEQKLRDSEVLLRQVLECIPDSTFAVDRDYRLLIDNQRHQQELVASGGHPFDIGEPMLSPAYPAEVLAFWRSVYDRAFNGETFSLEGAWLDINGQPHTHENRFSPLRDATGAIFGALVVAHDITERKQAEKSLRESEENYKTLFENNPQPMWVYDLETLAFLTVNEAAIQHYGYSREEFLSMTLLDIRPKEDFQRLLDEVASVTEGFNDAGNWRHIKKDGSIIDVEITSHTLDYYGRKAEIVLANDITERKQAETQRQAALEKLRESEERLEMVMEGSQLGYWDWNIETGDVHRNQRWAEMLGYTLEEIKYTVKQWTDLHHPEDREAAWKSIQEHLEGKTPAHRIEYRMRAKDGQYKWILDQARVVKRDAHGKPLRMSGTHTDITDRKQAEEKLRESESRARAMLDAIPDMMFHLDRSGTFLNYKADVKDLHEQSDSLIGQRNRDIAPQEFADLIESKIAETLASGQIHTFEYQLLVPDTGLCDFEARMAPSGPDEVIAIVRNITERKQSESLLNQRLEDLALINQLNDAVNHGEDINRITEVLALGAKRIFGSQSVSVYLLDPDKKHLFLQHFTMPRETVDRLEKLIGRPIPKIDLPVGGDDHFSQVLKSDDGFLITGFEGITAWLADFSNTSFLPARVRPLIRKLIPAAAKLLNIKSVVSIPLKAGDELMGLIEFVADGEFADGTLERMRNVRHQLAEVILRKRTEQALLASNEKYRRLSAELEERVKERTAQVQDLYDNAPTGYHSLDPHGMFSMVNQTELKWLGYERDELLGTPFKDLLSEKSRAAFEEQFPIFQREGLVRDVELEFIRKDGSILPVILNAAAIYDSAGKFVMSRASIIDNTERKKAELALLQSRDELRSAYAAVERASRAKDEFLANMSHELRTPLNGILGISEIILTEMRGPINDHQRRLITTLDNSGRHLLNLINDILDLSKIEAGRLEIRPETILIRDVCQASLSFVTEPAVKKGVALSFIPDPRISTVLADPLRLKQILVNLLSNAVKFTPSQGKVFLQVTPDLEKNCIEFSITDTGVGIAPEDLARLFQPFTQVDSSLTRQYEGTGLGLALSKRLAELHGGSIRAESEVGKGSCFTISLPWQRDFAAQGAFTAVQTGAQSSPEEPAPTLGTILLAEDTETNILTIGDYLDGLGYNMVYARNGREAVEKAGETVPDLILMDIQMPEMNGMDAIRKLRTDPRFASTPIIALTALAMSGDRERILAVGANEYLSKPVRLRQLAELIKGFLHKGEDSPGLA
jgi:PAS domain S-box-containing protein